jgi:hypothetical protein
MKTLLVLSAVLAVAVMASGCAPDPLTLEQRVQVMVQMNRQLQLELLERDRRIAELAGGKTTTLPQEKTGEPRPGGELMEDPFKAVRITLGRLTGGMSFADVPYDQGVRVVILPEDKFGHVVARAGAIEVELFDLAIEGGDQRIGSWEFTVDQAVQNWVSGPLGVTGYSLELKWPNGTPPKHDRLTLLVRFTTLDGRPLTAQTDIKVALAGGKPAEGAAEPAHMPPGETPTLPPDTAH